MPGIIRCPESTAIQAGNPDHRGRGEEPGVSACSAGPGVRIPVGVVNARTALSSSSRSAFRLRGSSRGGGGCGRMSVGGSVSLRRQATCGDGGPAGIAARMLAASPAGMPAVLALPRGITVAAVSPAGARPQRRFAGGQLMTEAWSCGGPGQVAGRGGCRWRAEVPGHLGWALPGRRRGTLDSVRIRSDPAGWGLPGQGARAGGLLDSRREVPAVPDNIVLIMRFHPVGGEDVSVVSEDFGGEREALEAVAQALDERRSLVLTQARYDREADQSGVIINLANVVSVRVSKTDSAATGQYM